jgi:hypothetical protein
MMRSIVHLATLALVFAACGAPQSGPSETAEGGDPLKMGWTADRLAALSQSLEARFTKAGYWIKAGRYFYLQNKHCKVLDDLGIGCFGVNPASPYGMYAVPPAPGEYINPESFWDDYFRGTGQPELVGLLPAWRQRRDEAIVYIGLSAPNARYLGFANYVMSDPHSLVSLAFTETHTPENIATLTAKLGSAFSQPLAFVTTADKKLFAGIRRDLIALGFPARNIFAVGIPAKAVEMGLSEKSTTFSHQDRVAFIEGGQSYLDNPPVSILRIVPRRAQANETFEIPTDPTLATGKNEDHLREAQKTLAGVVARVLAKPSREIVLQPMFRFPLETQLCLEHHLPCLGTIDAAYNFTGGQLKESDDDFLAAVGVNHQATGQSTYANITFYKAVGSSTPLATAGDSVMQGSARALLTEMTPTERAIVEPHIDSLYVVTFARRCEAAMVNCQLIPRPGDAAITLSGDQRFTIFERAYLNPKTNRGPAFNEILAPISVLSVAK